MELGKSKGSGGKETAVNSKKPDTIHVSEFRCQTPLRFYEHCIACPRFDDCPDLELATEILRMRKMVNYDRNLYSARGELEGARHSVDAVVFHCLAPLSYFENTRMKCPHEGRCREEGLLLALLEGRRKLDYAEIP
jgi:hypothetical protein